MDGAITQPSAHLSNAMRGEAPFILTCLKFRGPLFHKFCNTAFLHFTLHLTLRCYSRHIEIPPTNTRTHAHNLQSLLGSLHKICSDLQQCLCEGLPTKNNNNQICYSATCIELNCETLDPCCNTESPLDPHSNMEPPLDPCCNMEPPFSSHILYNNL